MSLLRRRTMMDGQEREENVIYIDSGFLDTNVRYDEAPTANSEYPQSWATTYVNVQFGDIVQCNELQYYSGFCRIRRYYSSGMQNSTVNIGYILKINDNDTKYARLMYLYDNAPIPNVLTVTHSDETVTTYKIIDRR